MCEATTNTETPWADPSDSHKLHDPHIHPVDLARFLTFCEGQTDAYIHPRALTYPTTSNKANWRDTFPGAEELDVFNLWLRAVTRANTKIGLFTTWNGSWVKDVRNWERTQDRRYWHVWAAALVKKPRGYGKHLYIWDCDAKIPEDGFSEDVRAKYYVSPSQGRLIEILMGEGVKMEGIWYGGGCGTQESYVEQATTWVRQLALHKDGPFQEEDERFTGFKKFHKNK